MAIGHIQCFGYRILIFYNKYRLCYIKCDEVVFVIKYFLILLFLIFSIIGICECIYILRTLFFLPKEITHSYLIVTLKNGSAVEQLNYLWQKIKWHGDSYAEGIIALVDNLSLDEISDCNNFIDCKNIFTCSTNSLSECPLITQGEGLNADR